MVVSKCLLHSFESGSYGWEGEVFRKFKVGQRCRADVVRYVDVLEKYAGGRGLNDPLRKEAEVEGGGSLVARTNNEMLIFRVAPRSRDHADASDRQSVTSQPLGFDHVITCVTGEGICTAKMHKTRTRGIDSTLRSQREIVAGEIPGGVSNQNS